MSSQIKKSSTNQINIRFLSAECEVNDTLRSIALRWKMTVLFNIAGKSDQFSKLKERLPSISDQVLGKRLRQLEAELLIVRSANKKTVPVSQIYTVTNKGLALLKLIDQLYTWEQHWK